MQIECLEFLRKICKCQLGELFVYPFNAGHIREGDEAEASRDASVEVRLDGGVDDRAVALEVRAEIICIIGQETKVIMQSISFAPRLSVGAVFK